MQTRRVLVFATSVEREYAARAVGIAQAEFDPLTKVQLRDACAFMHERGFEPAEKVYTHERYAEAVRDVFASRGVPVSVISLCPPPPAVEKAPPVSQNDESGAVGMLLPAQPVIAPPVGGAREEPADGARRRSRRRNRII